MNNTYRGQWEVSIWEGKTYVCWNDEPIFNAESLGHVAPNINAETKKEGGQYHQGDGESIQICCRGSFESTDGDFTVSIFKKGHVAS
jgi:hypothetical protein